MTQCSVLRCPHPAGDLYVVTKFDRRIKLAICDDHKRQLESGEPRLYDQDQHVLLVGRDLAGTHDWIVATFSVATGEDFTDGHDHPLLRVDINLQRRGTDQTDLCTFLVSPTMAMRLADTLTDQARLLAGW